MSSSFSPPPPPPPPPTTNSQSSVTFIALVLAFSTVILIAIYVFLRYLSNRSNATSTERRPHAISTRTSSDQAIDINVANSSNNNTNASNLLQSLPVFDFGSVKGNLTGGDCAVCLSKFEATDQLRLLPLCCHAFHAECIDTWIVSNQTCPLCRSSVFPSESEVLDKIRKPGNQSFRIEIGSISRREEVTEPTELQSYSLGSFEYIVNGTGYEVSVEPRGVTDYKEPAIGVQMPEPRGEVLAAEVGAGGRGWMRDYFDVMAMSFSSRATSFRGSGRFFHGGSRRNGPAVEDLEANRTGEEIAEMFRWLSGI